MQSLALSYSHHQMDMLLVKLFRFCLKKRVVIIGMELDTVDSLTFWPFQRARAVHRVFG